MEHTIKQCLRQEERIRTLEAGFSPELLEQFRSEISEAPHMYYPGEYIWEVIHKYERRVENGNQSSV